MKILIIEDEKMIGNALKKGLEQEKFIVDLATTGTEGFDLAESEKYDLLILDLMLPGMDGLTICRKLRQENDMVPILMLTAKSQLQDKVTGFHDGADDYLTKPFAFEELLARVKALLKRPRVRLDDTIKVGDIVLNTSTFEVSINNQVVQLSKKEFSLLEFLMRHEGQVVTKELLISQVWEFESDVLPNTVEVTIRHLRQKIDHVYFQNSNVIKTIRGYGYKLEV